MSNYPHESGGPGMSPPPMHLNCPHCSAECLVPASQAGAVIDCPHCGGKFQAPVPTAQAAGFAAQVPLAMPTEREEFINKKVAAGVCGIALGGFGVHKFILGFNTAGAIMLSVWLAGLVTGFCLVVPLLASLAMSVIGMVEGILYLTKSDEEFYQTYAVQKKEWF